MRKVITILMSLFMSSCLDVPEGVAPIENFELERFLGTWYEIARLDHSFERDLSHVTAEYVMRKDGGVSVTNKGFSSKKNKWKDARGKAYLAKTANVGHLKVSFFGPFYGTYAIFELDEAYQYAFVSGSNTKYIWLLSRTPLVDQELKDHFVEKASELGFDTSQLIFVDQTTQVTL